MNPSLRPRLILAALLLAIAVSAVWWGPQIWMRPRYRETQVLHSNGRMVGLFTLEREDSAAEDFDWFRNNDFESVHFGRIWARRSGLLVSLVERSDDGAVQVTNWNTDGRISLQAQLSDQGSERVESPPWRWGKTDQAGPTLPDWLREWAEEEIHRREAVGK